jgi:hypothetical protein
MRAPAVEEFRVRFPGCTEMCNLYPALRTSYGPEPLRTVASDCYRVLFCTTTDGLLVRIIRSKHRPRREAGVYAL